MKVLIGKRKLHRIEASKVINELQDKIGDLSVVQLLDQYVSYINSLRDSLTELNGQICEVILSSDYSAEELSKEGDKCAEYDRKLIFMVSELKSRINDHYRQLDSANPSIDSPNQGRSSDSNFDRKLKLPDIPLPEFSNREGENIVTFLEDFEQIVDRSNLTSYEKFVYLQRQLKGDPLTLIKSLDRTEQNYNAACDLLQKAFASKVTQQNAAISRLASLKFGDDSFKFISEIRQISESFKVLNISGTEVLQYFIWQSMPTALKTQFIHITNKNNPSMDDINEQIFDAVDRYKQFGKMNKKRIPEEQNVPSVHAANVKTPNKNYCRLCSDDSTKDFSHSTFSCTKYSTPRSKLDRLTELNGCHKCANIGHKASQCRYRFNRKCDKCGYFHFAFLCSKSRSVSEPKPGTSNRNEFQKPLCSKKVFVAEALFTQYGNDVIVPTFSKRYADGSVIRAMRDTGCQPNFITHKAAKRLKLNILSDSIELKISGFNTQETYNTKLYEFKIDNNHPPITAIGIVNIKTKLKLPGLSVIVSEFDKKGYRFADEFLPFDDDEISSLDFVLGNLDGHILPLTDVTFGSSPLSMYHESSLGILLTGSIERLRTNLPYLKSLKFGCNPETEFDELKTNDGIHLPSSSEICNLSSFEVSVDPSGHIHDYILDSALQDLLSQNNGTFADEEDSKLVDEELNQYVLENMKQTENGRLI